MSEHPAPAPDLGALRARHVERPIVLPSGVPATYCPACGSAWPCDAARLYDAQAARLEKLAALEAAAWRYFHRGHSYPEYDRAEHDLREAVNALGAPPEETP